MSPTGFLSFLLGLTAGAVLIQQFIARRRRRVLRKLASQWRMNFNPGDQLRLAARVAHYLPIPGAASVMVGDVIYGIEGDSYRYIFTVGYTLGVLRTKRRMVRVAAFAEPRDHRHQHSPPPVALAPANLPILEQYRSFAALSIARA
jgi:hypothetical protein